jgi:hypothetical protein
MFDGLSIHTVGQLVGLVAVVGGLLIPIIAIISTQWARVRRDELRARQAETEAVLKQQMIERGMNADEIVRVLESGQMRPASDEEKRAKKDVALMQQMIDNGMSAEEIVRVLETARRKTLHPERDGKVPAPLRG